jgi:16S rRNA (adenine1518-N6/adenine1519-N6)-dimethyltransferase
MHHAVYAVKPKKSLGQHFLVDRNIARKIVGSLTFRNYRSVLEVGPGMGILTEFLMACKDSTIKFVEIDRLSVEFLMQRFPSLQDRIICSDILEYDLAQIFDDRFAIIGNFPYNISSQLFFKIIEHKNQVAEVVCMIQQEVAERITSPPGSRQYGILSVLLQAYYRIEYLFKVPPQVFHPSPKVKSAVIRLSRNSRTTLNCNEKLFTQVVKTAFNQRRKMLCNSLKSLLPNLRPEEAMFSKRPEQLSVEEFISLTCFVEQTEKKANQDCNG